MLGALAVALTRKIGRRLLLVQPCQKVLEPVIAQNLFHRVKFVAQLIVAPRLMDKILAGPAGWHRLLAALALRYDMVLTRLNGTAFTKDTSLVRHQRPAQVSQLSHNFFTRLVALHPLFTRSVHYLEDLPAPAQKYGFAA